MAAQTAGTTIQSGARGAAESFNKFVEGQDERTGSVASRRAVEPERKDFWDSFGEPLAAAAPTTKPQSSTIGTSAMRGGGGAAGGAAATGAPASKPGKEDGWGDDW